MGTFLAHSVHFSNANSRTASLLFSVLYLTYEINSCDCATRGHDYKLFLAYSRLNVHKYIFSERVVPVWNNLESNVINFSNINRFKSLSLVHVTDCINVYCLHIKHCIMICVACK